MAPATRRRRLIIIFGSLFGLPVALVLVLFFVPAISFSPEALEYSIARETDSGTDIGTECNRHLKGGWSCWVSPDGSGLLQYRVEMHGSRCWKARTASPRDGRDYGVPLEAEGCLRMRDQLRLWDRLF